MKEVADLCVHCHSCRLECPAGVDIPKLMMEAKAAYLRTNGLRIADWAMTHLDFLASVGRLAAPLTNWALGNRQMRWCMEKTLGIAQGASCRAWRRGRSCAAPPAAGSPAAHAQVPAAAANTACSISSIPSPTITIPNWPRPW